MLQLFFQIQQILWYWLYLQCFEAQLTVLPLWRDDWQRTAVTESHFICIKILQWMRQKDRVNNVQKQKRASQNPRVGRNCRGHVEQFPTGLLVSWSSILCLNFFSDGDFTASQDRTLHFQKPLFVTFVNWQLQLFLKRQTL